MASSNTPKSPTSPAPDTPRALRPQFASLAHLGVTPDISLSGQARETQMVVDEYNIILRNPFRFDDGDPLKDKLDNGESFKLDVDVNPGQARYANKMAQLEIPCTFFCGKLGPGRDVRYAFYPFGTTKVWCESPKYGRWIDPSDMTLDRYFKRDRFGDWRDETTGALMRSITGYAVRSADQNFYHGFVFEEKESTESEDPERPPTRGKNV